MNARRLILAFSSLLLTIAVADLQGQIPRLISYQGVIADPTGSPVPDGVRSIELTLYQDSASTGPLYTQSSQVEVRQGYFAVLIGPLPEQISFERGYWIGVSVDGESELEPRTRLTAAPYALRAASASWATFSDTASVALELADDATVVRSLNGLDGHLIVGSGSGTRVRRNGDSILIDALGGGSVEGAWLTGGNTISGDAYLGTLNDEPLQLAANLNGAILRPTGGGGVAMTILPNDQSPSLLFGHTSNVVENGAVGASIAGGGSHQAPNRLSGNYSTIGGGRANRVTRDFSLIAGGSGNVVEATSAAILGGMGNRVSEDAATIGGGSTNVVEGLYGTIGGGVSNLVDDEAATVGGGSQNQANSIVSVVAGGSKNNATGRGATVGGGESNLAYGGWGTIGGGELNHTAAEHATVAGGRYNYAYGDRSTIGGGMSDTASGDYSVVAGGLANRADGRTSSILGGERNRATGVASTVIGGINNNATGDLSVVLGGRSLTISGTGSTGFLAGSSTGARAMSLSADNVALFGNVDVWIGSNDNEARQLRLYSPGGTTGDFPTNTQIYSSFESPAAGVSQEYILPSNRPSPGDQLVVKSVSGNRIELEWKAP